MTARGQRMRHRLRGLSLVEFLIATVLSLFISGAAMQVYIGARTLRNELSAQQAIQEGARLALSIVGERLRLAGYWGCMGSLGGGGDFRQFALQAWEAEGSAYGQVLELAAEGAPVAVTQNGWHIDEAMAVPPPIVALSGSDIFRTWNAEPGTCNVDGLEVVSGAATSDQLAAGGNVQSSVFFLSKRGGAAASPPSLYVLRPSDEGEKSVSEELVEGVENMQFLFGMLDAEGATVFRDAASVTDFSLVTSVRVELLMHSVGYSAPGDGGVLAFHGVSYSVNSAAARLPRDGHLRSVYEATFTLRNPTRSR